MKLTVIAVGNRMPNWVQQGWETYARRLPKDYALSLREVKAEPRNSGKTVTQIMQAEANRISTCLPKNMITVVLDERGQNLSTVEIANKLKTWHEYNENVAFLIGGPDGLAPKLKQDAQEQWRLSSLTLAHPLVRVLLVEQLYRAWTILHNHPYHRA